MANNTAFVNMMQYEQHNKDDVVLIIGEEFHFIRIIGELILDNLFNDVYLMSETALTTCISTGQLASDHAVATLEK